MTRAVTLAEIADTNTFVVDGTNNRVGIGSTLPTEKLDVVGVVSATSFFGSGANLTGITAGATLSAGSGDQKVVLTSKTAGQVMTTAGIDAELTYNSTSNTLSATTFNGALTGNASGLTGTPDITLRNIIGVGATLSGVLTYEDVTNIDSVGIVTARTGIKVLAGGINAVGVVTGTTGVQVGSGQSFGANGPTAIYYGDGSNLTGISAGGISTTKYSPTANAIINIGLSTAQHHDLTLTAGITTITCSGGVFGESHSLVLTQPSSGIATVGFSTFFLFPSGATPSMSEGGSKVDLVSFVVKRVGVGGTQLLASAGLNYN